MAAAGGAQQRGASLGIGRIDRKPQVEQALHRFQIAGDGRGRQVDGLQGSSGQRPASPFEPMAQVVATGGERHSQRGLAVRRAQVRQRAGTDHGAHRGFATERRGDVDRRLAARITAVGIHALRQQGFEQALPAEADGQHDRGILARHRAEGIGAALEQRQRGLLGAARDVLAALAGNQETRQPAAAANRLAAIEQALQRRLPVAAAIEQLEQDAVVPLAIQVCRRAVPAEPVECRQVVVGGKFQQQFGQRFRAGAAADRQHRFGGVQLICRQRLAEQFARRLGELALGHAFGNVGRQHVLRIEHRHLRPATVLDGDVDRTSTLVVRLRGVHAHGHQLAQQFGLRAGQAGEQQGVALVFVDGLDVRLGQRESRDHRGVCIARRFEQRRHALRIVGVAIGAGVEQRADHFRITGSAGLHQRGALLQSARIDARLVPQQQLRAARIVVTRYRRPARPAGRRRAPAARRVRSGNAPAASCPKRRRCPAG